MSSICVSVFRGRNKRSVVYKKCSDKLTFFRNSPYSLAIALSGQSKKAGIEEVVKALALAELPTYAFDDGHNDLGMFEAVETAVAMENAGDHMKSQANFITKSYMDDGIRFGLT